MHKEVKAWIEKLALIPHPEGGYFREIYKSEEIIPGEHLPKRFTGSRVFATSIYYLLAEKDFSAFHSIKQDEIWHFYAGSALTIHMIDPAGKYFTKILGRLIDKGETLQVVVPAGYIFGATVTDITSYTLAGCTVAPGFDYADFQLLTREELLQQYPHYRQIIEKLTKING